MLCVPECTALALGKEVECSQANANGSIRNRVWVVWVVWVDQLGCLVTSFINFVPDVVDVVGDVVPA